MTTPTPPAVPEHLTEDVITGLVGGLMPEGGTLWGWTVRRANEGEQARNQMWVAERPERLRAPKPRVAVRPIPDAHLPDPTDPTEERSWDDIHTWHLGRRLQALIMTMHGAEATFEGGALYAGG